MSREAHILLAVRRLAWVIVILVLAGSAFAKSKIQSKYDKFKNSTEVSTEPVAVQRGFRGSLRVSFSYICMGNTDSCHPDKVSADFHASSLTGLYTKVHSVIFLADGARILPVERESWDSYVGGDPVSRRVYETITAQVNVADFLKIASASHVEGEVGPTRFTVKDNQLEVWQELAKKIGH
jgi:hypothetical protein